MGEWGDGAEECLESMEAMRQVAVEREKAAKASISNFEIARKISPVT